MNKVQEIKAIATYVDGFANGKDDEILREAARWLAKLACHICAQGYIGCHGGDQCDSDHK